MGGPHPQQVPTVNVPKSCITKTGNAYASLADVQEHNLKIKMLQAQASQKPDKPGPCGFNLNHDCKQNSSWHRLCPVLITSVIATLRGKSDVQINPCVKEKQHCGGANYKPFERSLSGSQQRRKPERLRQCKYSSAGVRMGGPVLRNVGSSCRMVPHGQPVHRDFASAARSPKFCPQTQ